MQGSWRPIYTLGIICVGLLAVILGGALLALTEIEQSRIADQAAENRLEYTEEANAAAERCDTLLAIAEIEGCLPAVRAAERDALHSESNLQAQKTVAIWTRTMGIAAVIGMTVGIFGLGLIFTTFRETRRAAESSAGTLRSFIAKERAYLRVLRGNKTRELPSGNEGIGIAVKNVGMAPCTIIKIEWSYFYGPDWPEQFMHERSTPRVVPPQSEGVTPCLHWDIEPEMDEARILAGTIHYETLDHQVFQTHFSLTVKHVREDGYGGGGWKVGHALTEGRPFDT